MGPPVTVMPMAAIVVSEPVPEQLPTNGCGVKTLTVVLWRTM